ncbi:unnamed protein product [Hyaloperonospora brassicae]|uniref:Uncharacterized protein n=1 Tax=Hyaloperonospora brassicae TaxID=162125 RepID=A0AAV0UMK4_HYABA|nr:unnamed protein product [Hyaloperonospora brassicae]
MTVKDEATYGSGSSATVSSVNKSQHTERMDMNVLDAYRMSEELVSRVQQELQRKNSRCVMYQHVAVTFDGVRIDGGPGELSVTELEGGGVVWLQTLQSASDALGVGRNGEQNMTNKSAVALFLSTTRVVDVLPTTVHDTKNDSVRGVDIHLVDGHRVSLTFKPEPFAEAMHRDEFLAMLTERMKDAAAMETTDEMTSKRKKEELRRFVRRYTKLDEQSAEGYAIAEQVYANTGYHLGPMTKQVPKFSADPEYRKKTLDKLMVYLNRANQEWKDADSQREMHTKAKHRRNEHGLFEYTDTVTGTRIPLRDYEQRYLEYTNAHEVDPVLHLLRDEENEVHERKSRDTVAERVAQRSEPSESGKKATSLFMATLGIDIGSSCIIDNDFFGSGAERTISEKIVCNGEDVVFRAAVNDARENVWNSWSSAFDQVSGHYANQAKRSRANNQSRLITRDTGTQPFVLLFLCFTN